MVIRHKDRSSQIFEQVFEPLDVIFSRRAAAPSSELGANGQPLVRSSRRGEDAWQKRLKKTHRLLYVTLIVATFVLDNKKNALIHNLAMMKKI